MNGKGNMGDLPYHFVNLFEHTALQPADIGQTMPSSGDPARPGNQQPLGVQPAKHLEAHGERPFIIYRMVHLKIQSLGVAGVTDERAPPPAYGGFFLDDLPDISRGWVPDIIEH